jgi:hypothetical protein
MLRGMGLKVNGEIIEVLFLTPKRFFPDVTITKVGLYLIVNATKFEVRWDGG